MFLQQASYTPSFGGLGFSQGGWVGPMAAARSKAVAFVIACSAAGVSPGEQMDFLVSNKLRLQGRPGEEISEALQARNRSYELWRTFALTGKGWDDYETLLSPNPPKDVLGDSP